MMPTTYRLPEEFQTARYRLRRVEVDDAQAIFESYAHDASVTRFLGWKPHQSAAETTLFLKAASREWETGVGFPVVAFPRERPTDLIGMFHPHLIGHRVNFGYVLRASAWGKGAASEVMAWLVEHALAQPKIFRAEAFCDVDNLASARVMEKSGMKREGI